MKNKLGVADYGMDVWDGGLLNLEMRLETLKSLGLNGTEMLKAAEIYASYGLIWPMFYTAVFYLIFVGVLTLLFGYFEKKLSYYKV